MTKVHDAPLRTDKTRRGSVDALYPPGDQWYWRADFVNELSDEAIALHVKHGSALPT
jgi:hypothetical protein